MSGETPAVRQVIVVEGRYDKAAVLRAVDAAVVETGGFHGLNDRQTLQYLRKLARERGVILLTDSDGAGQLIRGRLRGLLGEAEVLSAYIPDVYGKERRKAKPSKEGKIGVEGMPPEVILAALKRAGADFGEGGRRRGGITKADLYALGLSGGGGSGDRRLALQSALGFPQRLSANGFLDALNALFTLEELKKVLAETEAEQ